MAVNYSEAMTKVAVLAALVGTKRHTLDEYEIARILNMPIYKIKIALKDLHENDEIEQVGLNWRYVPYSEE
jgi:hypothetical protein